MKIFKTIFVLFFSVFCFQTLQAQLECKLESIIANLNGNSSFKNTADKLGNSINSGVGFGLNVAYQFPVNPNKTISIQPEVHINFKTVQIGILEYATSPIILTRKLDGSTEIDNLDFHLLFRYNLPAKSESRINFVAGPFCTIGLGGNTSGSSSMNADPNSYVIQGANIPYSFNFTGNSFGLTFGLGVSLKLPKGELAVDARFNSSLTNVYTSTILKTSADEQLFLQWWSIGLGYKFGS